MVISAQNAFLALLCWLWIDVSRGDAMAPERADQAHGHGNKVIEFAHEMQRRLEHDYPRFSSVNIMTLLSWTASCAMIFGGVVPYIPQYHDILVTRNSEGFSTYVCLALLVANVLRILFWFGHPFELPLLAQSVIMIIAMLVMLELCTRIRREGEMAAKTRKFADFDVGRFWKWSRFQDYVQCMVLFSLLGSVVTFALSGFAVYLETLGFVSVFTEALLGAPQFYRNLRNRSTLGMSVKMVCMWFCGDAFKTCYFIVKEAPVQFSVCGLLQVSIDIAILLQVFHYRDKSGRKEHPSTD